MEQVGRRQRSPSPSRSPGKTSPQLSGGTGSAGAAGAAGSSGELGTDDADAESGSGQQGDRKAAARNRPKKTFYREKMERLRMEKLKQELEMKRKVRWRWGFM